MREKVSLRGLQQQTDKNLQFNITIKNADHRVLVSRVFTGQVLDTIPHFSYCGRGIITILYTDSWRAYRVAERRE